MESYKLQNLTFTYPKRNTPALSDLSFTIEAGQFVSLIGLSGCGKTTLLRSLKPALAPRGEVSGEVFFEGVSLKELDSRTECTKIGFVAQNPDNQLVTDKVWHELAFGLESLGYATEVIRLRVAEMASFFGIQTWFHKNVTELSGGQKQLLNLASVMVMQPSALILDEPTSQLDPIAASELLAVIGKLNRELGVTVIMTEHRLEEVFSLADRVIVLDAGHIIADGIPAEIGLTLKLKSHGMFCAMPVPVRVYAAVESGYECPVTVREGREWLNRLKIDGRCVEADDRVDAKADASKNPSVELSEVWFRYEKALPEVVRDLTFKAYAGEITAILGGNGTGKTTMLSLISGLNQPYRGKVLIAGEAPAKLKDCWDGGLGVLPQDPKTLFVGKSVEEDLREMLSGIKLGQAEKLERMNAVVSICRLEELLNTHPYDLSGGEQQRAALAKVLLLNPGILLLDEPTKGLDAEFKLNFAGILRELADDGATVIMVSHDLEFCAEHADRCALFFDGNIVSVNQPRAFFSGNNFYTSSANRMARQVLPEAITARDIVVGLGGDPAVLEPPNNRSPGVKLDIFSGERSAKVLPNPKSEPKLELRRKFLMSISAGFFMAAAIMIIMNYGSVLGLISGGASAMSAFGDGKTLGYGIGVSMLILLAGVTGAMAHRQDSGFEIQGEGSKRKLTKRTLAAAAVILLAVPLTIYGGMNFLGDRKYYFISILILLEIMIPFGLGFESRRPQARELVIIAVLCVIGVAGRAAFFMLPQFKPVIAIVIIAGVAFGGETGFLVGAMTAFVSNLFFGQGPWTPWQMFAFGIIGFLAGILFSRGILRRSRTALCLYGALAALLIYGPIMNSSLIFTYQLNPNKEMFYFAFLQGLPLDLIHAAATVTFLFILARPMLEKLERIKLKYGLLES